MAFLLGCEKVSLDFPTKAVFEGISLGVDEGARVGVVGRNGDGKSTLLRLMAGLVEPDEGRVIRTRGVSVGMLGQADRSTTTRRSSAPSSAMSPSICGRAMCERARSSRGFCPTSTGTGAWATCRADSVGAWTLRAFCAAIGTCSCSTSPRTISTCAPSRGLRTI